MDGVEPSEQGTPTVVYHTCGSSSPRFLESAAAVLDPRLTGAVSETVGEPRARHPGKRGFTNNKVSGEEEQR